MASIVKVPPRDLHVERSEADGWIVPISADLVVLTNPLSQTADAVRSVQSQLQRRVLDQGIRSVAILGDSPNCGANIITANLVVACAQTGQRTAVVDADLKGGKQAEIFGIDSHNPGLADWLECEGVTYDVNQYFVPVLANLTVIPAGRGTGLGEPLQQPNLLSVMGYLSRIFDVVVYHAPPATDLANALALAAATERTILIGREQHTRVATLQQLQSLVEQCRGKVEGVILSRF
jgi:protein-tyrosine kinase